MTKDEALSPLTGTPYAFRDLPADAFPMTTTVEDSATGEILWRDVCDGPGAMAIPALRDKLSPFGFLRVRVYFGNGEVQVYPPEDPETVE